MKTCGSFIIGLLVCLPGFIKGQAIKRWKPSTNFERPENWDVGRVPCSRDSVVFPRSSPPVYVQTNATLRELVLPLDGEFVLGNYMSITFPTGDSLTNDNTCTGATVKYNHTVADSWFDISNWCVISDIEGDCSASQPLALDSEKIPCQYDTSVFAQGQTFQVDLGDGVDVYIRQLYLDGRSYTTGSFRRYLKSTEGKKQFARSNADIATTVSITGNTCDDASGCACGNEDPNILNKICERVQCETKCEQAFTPMGSCCGMCGALFEFDYTNSFKVSSLRNMIERNYIQKKQYAGKYKDIKYIISKTSLDHIQLVLMDSENGDFAKSLGSLLKKDLQKDVNGRQHYGISHIDLTVSTSSDLPSTAKLAGQKSMNSGTIVGLIIGILILLAIIILLVFCFLLRPSHKRATDYLPHFPKVNSLKSSFKKFNRFTMKSEDGDNLEIGPTIEFTDTVTMSDLVRGFDNPMYAEIPSISTGQITMSPEADMVDTGDLANGNTSNGFSNPLYGQDATVQEMVHQDLGVTTVLKFNPVFSTDGIEEDSNI